MPWTPDDGPERHQKKAKTPAEKKQWSSTANAAVKNHPSKKKAK